VDRHSRLETQRRFLQQRQDDLLARVGRMGDEELRWTVRLLADCLSPEERTAHLSGYSEHCSEEELRAFVARFVPRYTERALAELRAKTEAPGTRLADLTEEELQGMSLAEKWTLLAADPESLRPDQARHELARLFMCKSRDLFHDAGLSEAAVEFPAYHRVREALEAQSDQVVADLTRLVVERVDQLGEEAPDRVEAALTEIREAMGRALGILIPADQLFSGQMLRLPLPTAADAAGGFPLDGATLADLAGQDRATAFLVLADLMSLREWEVYLLPLKRQYSSLDEVPQGELGKLLPGSLGLLGDRRITDFAERYRSGRMVADRKVGAEIWHLLSQAERLPLLERDNRTMDVAQAARSLAKLFFSYRYAMLFDAGFHVDLLRSARYHSLVRQLIALYTPEPHRPALDQLLQTVTRMMLDLEGLPREVRPGRLQEIRALIASALGLPDDLTYPAGREGRA
jgi:hypothetical protein